MTDTTDIIRAFAPAKLNLYLHITGRRPDGYHDLDSLIAFASIGDTITLRSADGFSFVIDGAQAAALAHENNDTNLVVAAARTLAELTGHSLNVALTLTKNLPVASGIGGGSSDAAATLRALARHWGLSFDDPRIEQAAARHGQDVPVCLGIENKYMTADGIIPAPCLPRAGVVLVNPNRALPTPAVYREYRAGADPFSPLARLQTAPASLPEMVDALKLRGNDLYPPACRLMPALEKIVATVAVTPGCLLTRMSGSGATCFGLYADADLAAIAAAHIRALHPHWWVSSGMINDAGS